MVRYERTCSTHGDTFDAEGIYGTEGFIQWSWLPFGENLHVTVDSTQAPKLKSEVVYPIAADGSWVQAPVCEFDRYLRGAKDAQVLVNEKALEPFGIVQAIYDSAESGQPITLDFS